jgi:hypothetical protein
MAEGTGEESRSGGKRVGLWVAALAAVGVVVGTVAMFGWMIDETHFDRPHEGFDRLTAQIESLPGVSIDEKERWVEAPTFSDPPSFPA